MVFGLKEGKFWFGPGKVFGTVGGGVREVCVVGLVLSMEELEFV